jgi:hypothetical protein
MTQGLATAPRRFTFAFDGRFKPLLRLLGVSPSNADVEIGDHDLSARFGKVRFETPLDNIESVELSGPYHWWKAIGIRTSLTDRGLTFGSSLEGVCLKLKEPLPAKPRFGKFEHPGLTVTVEDRDGFAAAVRAAAGL